MTVRALAATCHVVVEAPIDETALRNHWGCRCRFRNLAVGSQRKLKMKVVVVAVLGVGVADRFIVIANILF